MFLSSAFGGAGGNPPTAVLDKWESIA